MKVYRVKGTVESKKLNKSVDIDQYFSSMKKAERFVSDLSYSDNDLEIEAITVN